MRFNRLSIRNFKRYSGDHEIPLSGEGRVTVIAAENGVGKTTTMEAIQIALYGKKGFDYLYPKMSFEDWLEAAYSVDGKGDRHILLALEMEDPILGPIRVSRTFWLLGEEFGGLEEEVGIEVSGKPLEREGRESLASLAERWIEDYLPHSAMRRFLVDGERLSHLDPKRIDDEIVRGMDDVIGIGLLHKMRGRILSVRRETLKALAPDDEEDGLDQLLGIQQECEEGLAVSRAELESKEVRLVAISEEIGEIQVDIENATKAGGGESVQLRMEYMVKQSELTSIRSRIHEQVMGALPFVIAGAPGNMEKWRAAEVLMNKKSEESVEEHLAFLLSALDQSGVGERTKKRVERAGFEIADGYESTELESPLESLTVEAIEQLMIRHGSLFAFDSPNYIHDLLDEGVRRLESFELAENRLRAATAGSGIGAKAAKLKSLATEMGAIQAEVAGLKGEIERLESSKEEVVGRIGEIRQNEDPTSKLNVRLSKLESLLRLCEVVTDSVRRDFAEPLEEAFAEGFELLSRKSGSLEGVSIDTSDYSTHLSMRGFDGNWLDRGLSATERQHVGLALVYALRRSASKWSLPLPVVVDTPTSRMDRRHKTWSVTKFYPQLSNQVIVFATSDDLADGLFEELSESGSLGLQMLIREVSENSVVIEQSDLRAFFG